MKPKKKKKVDLKDPVKEYKTTIKFTCPVRGEVSQVVVVKQYGYNGSPEIPMR